MRRRATPWGPHTEKPSANEAEKPLEINVAHSPIFISRNHLISV
jgi:hypothetical protein